jgi:hypothetical protein
MPLAPELRSAIAAALRAAGARFAFLHGSRVRGYVEVDDSRVVAQLDRLDDIAAYVSAVARFAA